MIGIRAFSALKHQEEGIGSTDEAASSQVDSTPHSFDTIVVPAKEDGFNTVFIGENRWYAIRMNKQNISKIKYIAAYQVAPVSAITHLAEISEIVPYQNSGKYLVKFKGKAEKIKAIPLKVGLCSQPQAPRYTLHSKIATADYIHELWD